MHDLRPHLNGLLCAQICQPRGAGGRITQFIAARPGEGTSSMAASAALRAAETANRPVWLIDTDFLGNPLYTAFAGAALPGIGRPGRPLDASLGTAQIYHVPGACDDPRALKLLTLHQIGDTRLYVTRFRTEHLSPGQIPQFADAPDWWAALRRIAGSIIIDCPAFSVSRLALQIAPVCDGAVLVVQAEATPAAEVAALTAAYEAAGGRILGAVLNRAARWG
jgi:hypothetical protein